MAKKSTKKLNIAKHFPGVLALLTLIGQQTPTAAQSEVLCTTSIANANRTWRRLARSPCE